jgi:hypothetical protein
MKFLKIAVAVVFAMGFGRAYAFHSGGVAECDGCHTMHNSETKDANTASEEMNGNGPARGVGVTGPWLLQGSDPSSTCLICHGKSGTSSYHIYSPDHSATAPFNNGTYVNYTPGGDFSWLNRSWGFTNHGELYSSPGMRHGHSIQANDFSLALDSRQAPPGGDTQTWNGGGFSCVSCHDPHGKWRMTSDTTITKTGVPIAGSGSYGGTGLIPPSTDPAVGTAGVYRLLGGAGYAAKSSPGIVAFTNDPPIALAPSSYNQSETAFTGQQSPGQVIVAYGSGMSEWCMNCHPKMHSDATGLTSGQYLRHPAGSGAKMSTTVQGNYNTYVRTGTIGALTDNYDSLIPFESGKARSALPAVGGTTGGVKNYIPIAADANSNPMCLSCHRAHASAFDMSLRWNMNNEFVTGASNVTFKAEPAGGRTVTDMQAGMYMRPAAAYSVYQRVLCNKCHAKD